MQEFTSISVSSYEADTLTALLNEKSGAGWTVVSIVPTGSTVTAYLSKEKSDDEAQATTDAAADRARSESVAAPAAAAAAAGHAMASDEPRLPSATPAGVGDRPDAADKADEMPEVRAEHTRTDDSAEPEATKSEHEQADREPSISELAAVVGATAAADEAKSGDDDKPAATTADKSPVDEPAGWATGAAAGTAAAASTPSASGTGTPTTVASTAGASTPGASTTGATTPSSSGGSGASSTPSASGAAASSPAAAPAGWYADPSSRYELRYWDGSQWTEHVSRGGQQFTDPPVA